MQYIRRALQPIIAEKLSTDNRLVLLLGPRQAGKTTLAKEIMEQVAGGEYLALSGEDPRTAGRAGARNVSRSVLSGEQRRSGGALA